MAKPKTKGQPIQVRLPLPTDTAVRAQAARTDRTPAAVVEAIVVASHRSATRSAGGQSADDPACEHPKAKVTRLAAGLAKCGCGATRGVDGTWR